MPVSLEFDGGQQHLASGEAVAPSAARGNSKSRSSPLSPQLSCTPRSPSPARRPRLSRPWQLRDHETGNVWADRDPLAVPGRQKRARRE